MTTVTQSKAQSTRSFQPKSSPKKIKTTQTRARKTNKESDYWKLARNLVMDAEKSVEHLGSLIENKVEMAGTAAEAALVSLDKRWQKLDGKFHQNAIRAKNTEKRAHRAFDTAKVKLHLARLDTADAMNNIVSRCYQAKDKLEDFAVRANFQTAGAIKRLSVFTGKVADRLLQHIQFLD